MKKNKIYNVFVFVIVIAFLSACKKENRCDCIKRTGEIVTEIRSLKAFDRLRVEEDVNVFITDDVVQEVKVEAGENIVPLIETVVEDGTLIIRNHNKCNWARSYKKPLNVYIRTPGLRYIKSKATSDIKSLNTINKDSIDISIENSGNIELTVNSNQVISHIFGSGDLTLHGKSGEHLSSIGGTSFLYCQDLNTSYTWVETFTTATCYVNANGLLQCLLDGIGDIHCTGHPVTVQQTHKSGSTGQLYIE